MDTTFAYNTPLARKRYAALRLRARLQNIYDESNLWEPLLIQISKPDKARVKNCDDAYV
jgi:hypothetical protein